MGGSVRVDACTSHCADIRLKLAIVGRLGSLRGGT